MSIDLYWLPLGAGGRCVRFNGRVFEALAAGLDGRRRCDLYHSALEVSLDGERFVVEMAPVWSLEDPARGVVCEGPVGLPALGAFRAFRYEVRCWRDGCIPDVSEAVDSPVRLSVDPERARRLLDLVPRFPPRTWGRDELMIGEMWNSNSLVSWLLVCSGHDVSTVSPPAGGRAPGWTAGIAAARDERRRAPGRAPPVGRLAPGGGWRHDKHP